MSANLILIIAIVGISLYAWRQPNLYSKMLMHPYSIKNRNEFGRFITSGLIHKDYGHLFFNMFTLYFFGGVVESIFGAVMGSAQLGSILYIVLFFAGVVISDLPTYFKHQNDPGYSALGASGGVSSVLFASILYNPIEGVCLWAILCIPGFLFGALYLIYSYYENKRNVGRVNHSAHFYGAIFGVVFGIAIRPAVVPYFIDQISNWSLF
ncbi:rhomboid family intramembrane serine protease [Limibacter armeniacum]|uniref:rhomboid family intramembrane serine protease n=1 Tax=Limibacter armeniacum TaxID=466084 RepID=UPI002FE5128E